MKGLAFDKIEFPFARGLAQKFDPRLVQAPELVRGVDVEFDETGGLRLRYPFAAIGTSIFGGGSIADCRRIVKCGDELLLFTRDTLYSWNAQLSSWVSKGTHLAIKCDESPVFVTPGDQVESDRAELSNTIIYTWTDNAQVYAAAVDKSTGSVLVTPTAISGGTSRPRVVALATKLLLFTYRAADSILTVRAIDPAAPGTGFASGGTNFATITGFYDVEKQPGADAAVLVAALTPSANYLIAVVSSAAVATSSAVPARTCDGPIAVALTSDGVSAQVARTNGSNIQGDLVTVATLADVHTGQALGAGSGTINQVTAAFAGSTATCHVFWCSSQATNATDWDTDYNTVTTANVVGSAARFIRRLAIVSRAFSHTTGATASVYVWLAFAGQSSFSGASPSAFRAQLQNTFFLYRHDGTWCSMAAWQRAAGFSNANGHLPGVALTSGSTVYSWCGGERRIVPLGEHQFGYSDRGPRDITFTFDSNEARRCAKLGGTLYISGSPILQYDGAQIVECGWPLYPHYFGAIEVGAGNLADGTYTLKPTWRWDNAKGERDRSTSATAGQVTIAAGPNGISIVSWIPLYVTRKTKIAVEVWRTKVAGGEDAPFFKTTSQDPTATSNPNRYIENDPTASTNATFNDELADSSLTTESHPENGPILENLAPPPATLIVANNTRLFLAGVAGDPHQVYYSKERGEGEVAAFHEVLRVPIPELGGDIVGLAFLGETLAVFKETAVYVLDGRGFDNGQGGSNFEPRLVPNSIGIGAVSHEAIAQTPAGIVFKSLKGWHLLTPGGGVEYIGAAVVDYDSETVHAVHALDNRHQVRCLTSGRMLVFDYSDVSALKWAEWSVTDGIHACIWSGTYHHLATASVKAEQSSYATADYGWDVEMLVHLGGLQGFARCRRILVLGEVRGAGTIRVRVGTYREGTYFDDKTWTISPTTVGEELEFQHGPSRQQHKALRIRLTSHTTAGEKPKLSALTLEVGLKPGVFRHLPAAQRQ